MILDINVWFGHWHSRKFETDTPKKLHGHLESAGIARAVVSSSDSIFCGDPEPWNVELEAGLAGDPVFIHAPVFRPTLANWREVLAGYYARRVRVLRILPGFHAYSPDARELEPVFEKCCEYGLAVIVQTRMEDERDHHTLVRIPPVKVDEMVRAARKFPGISFVAASVYFGEAVALCGKTKNVCVDISFAERMHTVAELLKEVPSSRVLFGSHTPFFYTVAALMKMERAEIRADDRRAILAGNACRILKIADR